MYDRSIFEHSSLRKGGHSDEQKAKIGAAIRAKWTDPEYQAKAMNAKRKMRTSNVNGQ